MKIIFIISGLLWIVFTALTIYAGSDRWFKTHRPWHPLGLFYLIMMWVMGFMMIVSSILCVKTI